jgi:hypothetical protein
LKIRFGWQHGEELILYRPDGQRFLSSVELEQRAMVAERMAGIAQKRSEQEAIRASMAEEKAEQESIRANRLAALLKAMGVDPDQ